jgi:curved DNA-binding protein CbpA
VIYTYYDYLELPPGANPMRIEAAFVALLERFGYGTTDAGQDMSGLLRMIQTAYDVLSNPDSRQRYDATLAREASMADAELKASLDQQGTGVRRFVQNPPAALQNAVTSAAA